MDLIHNKFYRKLLGVKRSTNIIVLYGELGRTPASVTRKLKIIKYWNKILSNENTLQFKIYQMLRNDANNITYGGQNWANQIKCLMNELGLTNIWFEQKLISIPVELINRRITDQYFQTWTSTLQESSRLENYSK